MNKSAIALLVLLSSFAALPGCLGKVVDPIPNPPPLPSPSDPTGPKSPVAPTDPYNPGDPSGPIRSDPGGPVSSCGVKLAITDCNSGAGYNVYEHTFESATTDEKGRAVYYLGVYETKSSHGQNHETGDANVTDTLSLPHTLILSAYEETRWHVNKAQGSGLERIITSGYYAQPVTVAGADEAAAKSVQIEESSTPSCAYSWPYNGGGCDTNEALKTLGAQAGAPVAQMSGCYQAATFVVSGDSTCTNSGAWQALQFSHDDRTSGCKGGQGFVKYNPAYKKWIGAELCSATSYKLYMSETRDGAYAPIADESGHGQDHCELVNPTFTLGNDDDVASGSCSSCSVTPFDLWSWPGAVPVYVRSSIGQPFELESWLRWEDPQTGEAMSPHMTSSEYSCGVSIP